MRREYSRQERLERASLRAATHVRGLWEETGYSDSRLIDAILLPDWLITVGITASPERPLRREHIVSRICVIEECKAMIKTERSDRELADLIGTNTKIVLISLSESVRVNSLRDQKSLKDNMPAGWEFGHDVFARLNLAGIEWNPYWLIPPREVSLLDGVSYVPFRDSSAPSC